MLATFPPNITNIIFRRLERSASTLQSRTYWREARRSLPSVVKEIPTSELSSTINSSNTIIVESPIHNGWVVSPLKVTGKALGVWFWEGEFSVELLDANRNAIAGAAALAKGDWTQNGVFVPFSAQLTFSQAKTKTGYLVFEFDSPKDGTPIQKYQMPVSFAPSN